TATTKNAACMPAALQFGSEVASHFNKTYDVKMKVGAEMFGGSRVHWFFDADNLDQMAQLNSKLMQDRTYWALIDKSKDLWLEGSLEDKVVAIIG
ncbi:MAG TPA: hypothetical protein VJ608_12400, partial [Albitalea sp.]|nr:hypothetical protein [Albitalea sp.]